MAPWSHGAGERAGKRVGMKFRQKQNSGSDQQCIPTKNDIDSAGRPAIKILPSVYIAGVTQHRKDICSSVQDKPDDYHSKHDWGKRVKNFRKFTG